MIVFEVGYNFGFKSHPELVQTKFITKAQACDLAQCCEKKVEMLMWGDRLIDGARMSYPGLSASHNGTARAVDLIPKDIIICDWHYDRRDDYPSVRFFQEKGFRVIPAGFNNVEATRALIACARRGATPRMLGHMITSWCLEPGGFSRALLGQSDPVLVSAWATGAAAACRAAMEELGKRTP